MTDSDTFTQTWRRHERAVAEANALNRVAVFDALDAAGITAVTVTFDGEGDSGQIEDVIAYIGDKQAALPRAPVTIHGTSWGQESLTAREQPVSAGLEDLCYGYLEQEHGGWENNDGAYGEFQFDVGERTIALEFNGRFSDVNTEHHTL